MIPDPIRFEPLPADYQSGMDKQRQLICGLIARVELGASLQFGTDPTLRYKTTSLQVNALTMLSKRVERGERPDVADLAARIRADVENSGGY